MKNKKILLWGLLIFNAFAGVLSLLSIGLRNDAQQQVVEEKKENNAINQSAQAFAQSFADQYFTWRVGDGDGRQSRLSSFLAKGLDSQAGLDVSTIKQNVVASSIQVWKVTETGTNKSEITVQASIYRQDPKTKEYIDSYTRYLTIPIEAKGPDQFVVSNIPYYVIAPNKPDISQNGPAETKQVNEDTRRGIEEYLNSFFFDYAAGTSEKINYFTQTEKPVVGFQGLMKFQKIESTQIFDGGDIAIAYVQVRFEETNTGASFVYKYRIFLKNEQGRWFITFFANDK